jgi:hypothetical protein
LRLPLIASMTPFAVRKPGMRALCGSAVTMRGEPWVGEKSVLAQANYDSKRIEDVFKDRPVADKARGRQGRLRL